MAGLGGNRNFVRSVFDARYYKSLIGGLVMRMKTEAGNIFATDPKRVQSAERFYLGGPNSLKGYDSFSVGPERKAIDPTNGREIPANEGGLNELFYILEFEYPLIREIGLKLVLFYDVGEAWNTDRHDSFRLHQDYGWGIRWFSPLGPLRFEWGYPINPKGNTPDGANFQFMIGPPF